MKQAVYLALVRAVFVFVTLVWVLGAVGVLHRFGVNVTHEIGVYHQQP